MREVDIIGVGLVSFGKHLDKSITELGVQPTLQAIRDAGIKPGQINAGIYSNVLGGHLFGDTTAGQNVFWEAGVSGVPIVNVENACTSGSTAVYLAWMGIACGEYDAVIVTGAEKLNVPGFGLISSSDTQLDTLEGVVTPASFGMRAMRHMEVYGTTREQLAMVSVKNRKHAGLNPLAQFRDPITVEDVLSAPMIADPFTRLMCCPNADGGAALVMCAAELSKRYTSHPIRLAASVLVTGKYLNPVDLVPWETDFRGCRKGYERAGLGPEDLDAAECHDAFAFSEIQHYEAMGLCREGEGGRLVESGATTLGGRIPVNTSGGLLSKGHPLGATGVAQIVEGVLQLRGQAGARQVEGAKVFLAQCMGGDKDADAKTCTVNILKA